MQQIKKIGLIQINNSFSNQSYLPYSVGLLQAYAQKHLNNKELFEFMLPIFSRIKVDDASEKLIDADIIFFSVYIWNIRLSLEIAKAVKLKNPQTITVFGGPQVPNNSEDFLRKNSFIDLLCHGEGEKTVCQIIENLDNKNWNNISSLSFLDEDGQLINTPRAPRMENIDSIPSPYLEGVFDSLMQEYPNKQWIVMWETNRGCPFSCTFCDWGSANNSKVNRFSIERLYREIDWFKNRKIEFVFCCDANFGILKRDIDIAKYAAESKRKTGYPQALSVQNTKNLPEQAYHIQKILADAGLNKGVTLSLQSTNKQTLKYVKRNNISLSSFQELQARFSLDNIETYTDIILALPGESYDTFTDGVSNVIRNGQHNRIQFGNLCIMPNAEISDTKTIDEHKMEIVETKIINIHGSLHDDEEIHEIQELVVATKTMPREDWVRVRAFCWMTSFLYFNKIMQIPLILLHKLSGTSFRKIIESFCIYDESFPLLSEIYTFFMKLARGIQQGKPEYCSSKKWLNIWWPTDELMLIRICTENKLDQFYKEAKDLLKKSLVTGNTDDNIIDDAIFLNKNLIKLPFQKTDLEISLSYNILELYYNHKRDIDTPIVKQTHKYKIDRTSEIWFSWEQWCREVIWWGNKKGAYLYKVISIN